jgi:hypothetical protein
MPPDAMIERNSNWRMRKGSITGCPHLLHGVVSIGARSPEMKFLAKHPPQTTIFKGLLDTGSL